MHDTADADSERFDSVSAVLFVPLYGNAFGFTCGFAKCFGFYWVYLDSETPHSFSFPVYKPLPMESDLIFPLARFLMTPHTKAIFR